MMARALLAACALAALAPAAAQTDEALWRPPHGAAAAMARPDAYAWRLFVALNWPADARTRAADAAARFGADAPAVWESWQNAVDVYRQDGTDPGPWRAGTAAPPAASAQRFETVSLKELPNLRHIVGGRMVPVTDPVAAARRLTEIRMNQAAYEYLRAHALYNIEGQLQAVATGGVAFPDDAIEVKAKWRPIEARERSRYHTLAVAQADGSERLYGLTALHVISKVLPNWFWATFEHVDNPGLPDAEGWQLRSHDEFACGPQRPDCNRAPAGVGLEDTVWQNYRLRGTMTRFELPDGSPARLANSELERGMQASSSCMTCHARASIGLAGGEFVRLPIFESAGASGDDAGTRRGYLGAPQAAWFAASPGAQQAVRMWPTDFVWSLSLAKSKRGS